MIEYQTNEVAFAQGFLEDFLEGQIKDGRIGAQEALNNFRIIDKAFDDSVKFLRRLNQFLNAS